MRESGSMARAIARYYNYTVLSNSLLDDSLLIYIHTWFENLVSVSLVLAIMSYYFKSPGIEVKARYECKLEKLVFLLGMIHTYQKKEFMLGMLVL